MSAYLVFAAIGLGTWLLRSCFIAVIPPERLPAGFRQSLDQLAPAVLAAVVALDVTAGVRQSTSAADVVLLLVGAASIALVAWRVRSSLLVAALAVAFVLVSDLVLG